MSFPIDPSPQERLAISRKAIVKHMSRYHPEVQKRLDGEIEVDDIADNLARNSRFSQVKYAAHMWWNRHPASAVASLATPFLNDYAKIHPFKLVGISVIAGVALVVVRPWRMISGSALIIAAVKSSGLSNTLLSMLSSMAHGADHTNIT